MKTLTLLFLLIIAIGCKSYTIHDSAVSAQDSISFYFPDAVNIKKSGSGVTFDIIIEGKKRHMFFSGNTHDTTICLEGCK
jgi:hypothetical protein